MKTDYSQTDIDHGWSWFKEHEPQVARNDHQSFVHARTLFDAMDTDQKDRVVRIFDLIRAAPGFPNVRDAFVEAVADETQAIEIKMLFAQPAVGTA